LSVPGARRDRAARWLLLPVEVKPRGFEGRLLLACHAAAAGWRVVFGRKGAITGNLRDLPRGLYFDKSALAAAFEQIRYTKALGNTYAALDEEGLVHEGGSETYPRRRLSAATLAECAMFCTWGQHQTDVVRAAYPSLADRLQTTGNPRVDLWRPELHEMYKGPVDAIRSEIGQFVLFPSNFANVVGADGPELATRHSEASGHYDDPIERARFLGYLEHRRRVLYRLQVVLPMLAAELPAGVALVIRPHPSEDHNFWRQVAEVSPRILVRYDGPLTPWMLASSAVVHSNCTTGVEALVAGVPAIGYAPLDDAAFSMLPDAVSHRVESDDALVDATIDAVAGRLPPRAEARRIAVNHLGPLDGALASARLMEALGAIDLRTDRLKPGPRRRLGDARAVPHRVRRRLRRTTGRDTRPPIRSSETLALQKFPPTELREVEGFIERLRQVTGGFDEVVASELGASLFLVEPRA
jgi:surface carbohydrate biosynthesis protein